MEYSGRRLDRRVAAVMGLAILAGLVPPAGAQDRPWKLPASAEFPNRFEGVIAPEVANPDFELLSFTGPAESEDAAGALKVDFYLPADSTASIQARELRNDKYYRMASKPGPWTPGAWNTFGPWPTADVIVPTRVAPDNIGIVVFLNEARGQSGAVAPAFVKGPGRRTVTRYTLVFRTPRTTLTEVRYGLRRTGANVELWSKTATGDFIRGSPVFLEFDAALEPGPYLLSITCMPSSAAAPKITREFAFHHARR